MTLPCLMIDTLGPGAMFLDLKHLCYHHYIHVLDPILQVIVTYYGDRSLRSSCIHYVLMLCSSSLLKGGLNIP